MKMYVISKVIKDENFNFCCDLYLPNLSLDHHKEEHVFRQRLYKSEETTAVALVMEKILM